MEVLILLGIAGAFAWLWGRVETLERHSRHLRNAVDDLQHALWKADAGAHGQDAQADLLHREVAAEESAPAPIPSPAPSPGPEPEPAPPPPAVEEAEPETVRESVPVMPLAAAPLPETEVKEEHEFAGAKSIAAWRPSFDFEDIFGRLLPIWAGGIALAIAGFFMVRWSIENGLLNEYVRVAMGFTFGALLIAAAELAHRFEKRLADPRVRQALAGAGLATLYASFYLAGSHYGMIGSGFAFAGLAGVTGLALLLSFRFGLPSAVLGLLGGFAAPALAGSTEPNLPMLATYLALVTGGLVYTGKQQDRSWLGFAALGGGLGWGALMLITGPHGDAAILSLGGYLVLLGTMLPALMGEGLFGRIGRIAACGIATLQIAALVDQSGYSLLAWGVYGLLAAAITVLGWQNTRMREAGAMAAGLSAILIAAWPDPSLSWLAAISASMAAIFMLPPLLHVLRNKAEIVDWAQLAAYPLALMVALCLQLQVDPIGDTHMWLAIAAAALAILPAIAAWKYWPAAGEKLQETSFGVLASAAVLLALAGLLATSAWYAPLITATIAAGLFALFRNNRGHAESALRWTVALVGVALLFTTTGLEEISRLVEGFNGWEASVDAVRWIASALPFALLLPGERSRIASRAAQVLAVPFTYGAMVHFAPEGWIPAAVAAAVLALAFHMRWRAAHAAAMGFSVLWAAPALAMWSYASVATLLGDPLVLMADMDLEWSLRTLMPLIAAWIGSLLLSPRFFGNARKTGWIIGGAFVLVMVHTLFKQLFGIATMEEFVAIGMAERTLWQAMLALPALALLTMPQKWDWQRAAGIGIALVPLAHFAWFTLGLHNPLWSAQAVGAMPVINWLLPAYGLAIAGIIALRGQLTGFQQRLRPVMDGVVMVLLGLLALSELRHAFSGTMLTELAMSQQEDLLRSILSIGLALAFLAWGSRKQQRSWRIGSLVLMLLAVTKVFLFDAAGLEGLARIASFLALGLCLIGIGWFYTRQLKADGHGAALVTAEEEG